MNKSKKKKKYNEMKHKHKLLGKDCLISVNVSNNITSLKIMRGGYLKSMSYELVRLSLFPQ